MKGCRIYRGQALELDPQNETLKACDPLKTFLAIKSEIDEHHGSSIDEDSKADEEERKKESDLQRAPSSFLFSFSFCIVFVIFRGLYITFSINEKVLLCF